MAINSICSEYRFASADYSLVKNHSCDVEASGGYCEDFPACGHEAGDCNGRKYGSDEQIIADVYRAARDEDFAYRMERQAEYDEAWS